MGIIKDKSTAPFAESETNPPKGEDAFLVINGIDLFPLKQSVSSIGRRIDSVLVINDPRVSRAHAELRCFRGSFVIFDMGSSGGT